MGSGWVFLCPGQGSQSVGMGKALYDAFPEARELYDRADVLVGTGLRAIAFEGPEDALTQTLNTQPALFTLDVVCARLLERAGIVPVATAGHSLGEYAAVVVAGALSFEDGLRLTRLRGQLMHEAGSARPGAMAAVLGLDEAGIERVLAGLPGVAQAANLNTPNQIVVSGDVATIEAALPLFLEAGARRALRLPVSGAFHSPLMEPAAAGLASALRDAPIRDARVPVVANATARVVQRAEEIREALVCQLTAKVRWVESMQMLTSRGHRHFVEVGPGRVLQGMLKQIDRTVETSGVDTPETLETFARGAGASAAAAGAEP